MLRGIISRFFYPDTKFVLDLESGSRNAGGKIHLWSDWNGANQLWGYELVSGGGTDKPESDAAGKILSKNEPYKVCPPPFNPPRKPVPT